VIIIPGGPVKKNDLIQASYCSFMMNISIPTAQESNKFFFDDNLHLDELVNEEKFIMDARHIETGESYPSLSSLVGKACFKADPIQAIQNHRYFIQHVEQVLL